ncbi:MAG TPA: alpha/beta hydrolase [Pedomonas sp.]|uniref:alpha/beta hydrolase n=1 Tax=Pedomonas sp. TaxID=2976421 RepID=UPI002F40C248
MKLSASAQALLDQMMEQMPDWGSLSPLEFRVMVAAAISPADPADRVARCDFDAGGVPVRLYRREEAPATHEPVLLYLHGGGYIACSIDSHERFCSRLARQAECAILSVDYRLAPEHVFPAAVEDAWTALNWLVAHAGNLGLDPRRIAVGGDSAGGTLATVAAIRARNAGGADIVHQLLIYPGLDLASETDSKRLFARGYMLDAEFSEVCLSAYVPARSQRSHPWASPLRTPCLAGLPPTTLLTAECDPLRDDAFAYAARLEDAGVAVDHRLYRGMYHGFAAMFGVLPEADEAMADAAASLRRAFAMIDA